MAMQDSGVPAAELETHIRLAETVEADHDHDWREIRRVAATFNKAEAA